MRIAGILIVGIVLVYALYLFAMDRVERSLEHG